MLHVFWPLLWDEIYVLLLSIRFNILDRVSVKALVALLLDLP